MDRRVFCGVGLGVALCGMLAAVTIVVREHTLIAAVYSAVILLWNGSLGWFWVRELRRL